MSSKGCSGRESRRFAKNEHKTRQLCEQASASLCLALADCHDPLLRDVVVETVEPAPNASRLRVIIVPIEGVDGLTILQALNRARGYLRRHIAGDIHRTHTPELTFELGWREEGF